MKRALTSHLDWISSNLKHNLTFYFLACAALLYIVVSCRQHVFGSMSDGNLHTDIPDRLRHIVYHRVPRDVHSR